MDTNNLTSEKAAIVKGMLSRGDRPAYIAAACEVPEAEVIAVAAGAHHTWVAPAPELALPASERAANLSPPLSLASDSAYST